MNQLENNIKEAEAALENKKAEYWIQYGVVLALKTLKEKEDGNATGTGRAVHDDESEQSTSP